VLHAPPILKLLGQLLPELALRPITITYYHYYFIIVICNIIIIIAVIRVQLMHAFLHHCYLLGKGDVLAMLNEYKLP